VSGGFVFISYSHGEESAGWAMQFAEALRDSGVNVWLDRWNLELGQSFADAIETALRDCDTLVAIMSRAGIRDRSVLFEIGSALGAEKRLVLIVPPDVERAEIPYDLHRHRYFLAGDPEATAREVAEVLK
jgi:hypothetical protein